MKGREYETFVFERFKRLFAGSVVTQNDRIQGSLSGLAREIDVSVRVTIEDEEFLYIAQCKDWKTPTDIKVLGEFSAVVRDVEASKGFLLCTSGFAKTNHDYAKALGIELFTIEDVNSEKWTTQVQIPFIYVRKFTNIATNSKIICNEELANKNRTESISLELVPLVTVDGGLTSVRLDEYIRSQFESLESSLKIDEKRSILEPNLHCIIAGICVPYAELSLAVRGISKKHYLKYLRPDEYCHLRDHVRQQTIPLHVVLRDIGVEFDDSFQELQDDELPIFAGLHLVTQEWTAGEIAHGGVPAGMTNPPLPSVKTFSVTWAARVGTPDRTGSGFPEGTSEPQ